MTEESSVSAPQGSLLRVNMRSHPLGIRLANRALLVQSLFQFGAMSRADLARETGLARPTVSALVADLEAEGIVADLGEVEKTVAGKRGKKGSLVDLRSEDFRVIALDLSSPTHIVGAITDMRGAVLVRQTLPFESATGEDAVLLVLQIIDNLRAAAGTPITGIGIATPGVVADDGVVRVSFRIGWFDVALGARVTAHTGLPAYVINDSRAAAMGVHVFEGASDLDVAHRSLMVVTIEQGVGAGIILGGSLVSGTHSSAGEIGHVTADENGPVCECGRVGCLDALVSASRLRARLDAASPASRGALLHDAGRALGTVLAPIVSALDLSEVVMCGPPDLLDGPMLRSAFTTIRSRNLASMSPSLEMRFAGSSEEIILSGATALVLSLVLGIG